MNYEAYIFDLDGTLYQQFPVRLCMAIRMILHYALRLWRVRELFAVLVYRKLRESLYGAGSENFNDMQIREVARVCGIDSARAEGAINFWMNEAPLKAVRFFRRVKLIEGMKKIQYSGKKIIVYSDYTVKEKLEALEFSADYVFWSNDSVINCMKPDSSGIMRAVKVIGLEGANILYIGDRFDRDGICAGNAGFDYMDVKEFMKILQGGKIQC